MFAGYIALRPVIWKHSGWDSLGLFMATGGFDDQRSDLALYEELRKEDDDSWISEDDEDDIRGGTMEDVFPKRPSLSGS